MTTRKFHGQEVRGLDAVPRSVLREGRFGRLFRNLPPLRPRDRDLEALAKEMVEPEPGKDGEDPAGDNPDISAGFTYFGQFVDHDLTFDTTSRLQRDNDPDAIVNFRTPRLDLDSVYGAGPGDQPFLYADDGMHFLIGRNAAGEEDLPRNADGRALIGDPRNDENLIVAQLHLAFLKYHNRVLDALTAVPEAERFDTARRIVRWHYQWAVVHDFLVKLVGRVVVDDILQPDRFTVPGKGTPQRVRTLRVVLKFFHWRNEPFMPVEFAVAAYRFGHSMVRGEYELNEDVQDVPIFAKDPEPDLRGFRELPTGHVIQWARFFHFDGAQAELQPARLIDTKLAFGLHILPDVVTKGEANPIVDFRIHALAERNLKRGKALGLPSGQDVARRMGIPEHLILRPGDLGRAGDPTGTSLPDHLVEVFGEATPLWFYILKEAEIFRSGRSLGPVGGRIVSEVLLGLLAGGPFSFLNVRPTWRPKRGEFGAPKDGVFGVADLLRFAGVRIE